MFVLAPDSWTPWANLVTECHRIRSHQQAEARERVAKREEADAPESDSTDYAKVSDLIKEASQDCAQGKDSITRGKLRTALDLLEPGPLVPDDYVPAPGSENLEIRVKNVSRSRWQAMHALVFHGSQVNAGALLDMLEECAEVRGLSFGVVDEDGEKEADVSNIRPAALWDQADIVGSIWLVVRTYNQLDAEEKKRFGLPAPRT